MGCPNSPAVYINGLLVQDPRGGIVAPSRDMVADKEPECGNDDPAMGILPALVSVAMDPPPLSPTGPKLELWYIP